MNTLELNLNLLSNRFYEFVWRSPSLFVKRVEDRLQSKVGWRPRLSSPRVTHAITWIRETADFHTRLYLFNYWTEHWGIPEMPVRVEVHGRHGELLGEKSFTLAPREMKVIEAAEFLKTLGIPGDFQGTFILFRQAAGAGAGLPLKMLQEYHGDNFNVSIHEYGTIENFGYHEFQMGTSIWASDDVDDIRIGMANCNFSSNGKPRPIRLRIYNHKGEHIDATLQDLGPGHSTFLSLNEAIPEWKRFVGDKAGNVGIDFPYSIGRPLVFIRFKKSQAYSLNHLTGDKSRPPEVLKDHVLESLKSQPIWVSGAVIDSHLTTVVSLINNWGFKRSFKVKAELFDQAGQLMGSRVLSVSPLETAIIDAKDFVVDKNIAFPWIGSFKITAIGDGFMPISFDANMEFIGDGWRQAVNLGSCFLNVELPAAYKSLQDVRTKNFMRVRCDQTHETMVMMVNHSSAPAFTKSSQTVLRLISQDGQRELTQTISIPPNGSLFKSIEEIFPHVAEFVGPSGVATLHIRDKEVKLIGAHLLRNRTTGMLTGDHYFGG